MPSLKSQRNKKVFIDLILMVCVNILFAFLYFQTDIFASFYLLFADYELIPLLLITLTLLVSFIYFSLRRWRDSVIYSSVAEQHTSKDSLTKLLNRRTLEHKLEAEWERFLRYHEDFSIVVFDIDDFKIINENLGLAEGDRVLIEIAELLSHNTRKTDLCARWGEEEFLILCPVCKGAQAAILAEKLRSSLYRTMKDGIELSASFAVAQSDNATSLQDLMKRVDLALHKAKQRGKNCVVSG